MILNEINNFRTLMGKISIYIPCYNVSKFLDKCIEGVLNQTYSVDEILVIDDGSTDNTVEIAKKYQVKIIKHEKNKGLAATRNTGLLNSRNNYVGSVDADCTPGSDWLEKLMNNFTSDDIAGTGGKLVEKNTHLPADRWRATHMKQQLGEKKLLSPPCLFGSNAVFRKNAILTAGLYNEKFKTNAEDTDICLRLKRKGYKLVYEPEAIVFHLRTDTITSILETYRRWTNNDSFIPTNIKKLIKRCHDNYLWGLKYFKKDLKEKNYSLLWIDFLFFFHLSYYDIKFYLSKTGEKTQ